VKHPESEGNLIDEEGWVTTLKMLQKKYEGSCHELNVEDVLDVMHTAVHKEHIFTGVVHCEIALVTLTVLFQKVSEADIKGHPLLAGVLQVMSYLCDHDAHQSDAIHRTWTKPLLQYPSGAAQSAGNSWTS